MGRMPTHLAGTVGEDDAFHGDRRKTQDAREEGEDRRPLRCKTEEARQEEERSVEEV